jgi:N-acetylglucosamine-6-phosphate deacetylase
MLTIPNVRILTEQGWMEDSTLQATDGIIDYIGPRPGPGTRPDSNDTDGKRNMLIPGFIDLHVHGGMGADFMDLDLNGVEDICRFHASHGTTGLLATTMTAPIRNLEEVIRFYNKYEKKGGGAAILGLHLEGPFINEKYKGAQNGEWIEPPTVDRVKRVFAAAKPNWIKMMTLAPELIEDERVFELLQQQQLILSAGHTDLDYEGGCSCIRKGVNHATHVGNAMRGFHHRDPGVIGLVMEGKLSFDLIADGIHVAPAFIRLLTRICALDQILLITDAMRAAGLQDGEYELGGQKVNVQGMEARLHEGVLAGSLLTMDQALKNFIAYTQLPFEQAIRLVTRNPARKLGLSHRKGSIHIGKDADLVLLNEELEVLATWVNGDLVYQKGGGT